MNITPNWARQVYVSCPLNRTAQGEGLWEELDNLGTGCNGERIRAKGKMPIVVVCPRTGKMTLGHNLAVKRVDKTAEHVVDIDFKVKVRWYTQEEMFDFLNHAGKVGATQPFLRTPPDSNKALPKQEFTKENADKMLTLLSGSDQDIDKPKRNYYYLLT